MNNNHLNEPHSYDNNSFTPYPEEPNNIRLKQSGPGIASFILGLVALFAYILTFFFAAMALTSSLDSFTPANVEEIALHPAVILASLSILVCLVLNLAGLIVGVIGLVLKNRKKIFAIIGTILNGILILAFAGLILAGMFMA